MFNKLRTNFRLSNLIVRILFVLTFIFCTWQDTLLASNVALQMAQMPTDMALPMMFLTGLILAVILMLIIPFATNVLLNFMRLYNIPRAEYVLIVMIFFTLGFFATGVLNLVNLFTPILLTWGSVLFPLLVSLGCAIGFYKVTADLYFNEVTRVYYFRNLAVVYFVAVLVFGVVL